MRTNSHPIRIGIAGLGTAGLAFIPAIEAHPALHLEAVAEPDLAVGAALAEAHQATAYPSIEEMVAHPGLNAVIIATPTPLHAAHTMAALAAGKHVVLEKPMATSLADALAMANAAEAAGRVLVVGHSHSFDLPIQRMRTLIAGGSLGRVRMINTWCFTDWMYRPRRPDELAVATGGGVTLRQGSHQFDIIRLLGGGIVHSIRAQTFDWDPERRAIGAHTAFLELAGGATATAVYNGYGGLDSAELCAGTTEWGFSEPKAKPSNRIAPTNVAQAKRQRSNASVKSDAPYQPHFGLTVVSCERGDIRQSPTGLIVYSAQGRQEITFEARSTPHNLVLAEFHQAVTGSAKPLHDGRWGVANLETCLAAIQSSETGQPVLLTHQVPVPAENT